MTAALISHVAERRDNVHAISHESAEKHQLTHYPHHEAVSNSQCHHVQRVQLFAGLEQSEMTAIATAARNLRKGRGEFVYIPGDQADSVCVLKNGRIKSSVLSESGKEIAIDIIQLGEMFGEFALIDESVRSNMTQALDEVAILVFNKRDFVNFLKNQSTLALNYIRTVGDRRRRMEKELADITPYADSHARVSTSIRNSPREIDTAIREIQALA
jgi:CRP-like cAMP-binding protein